ncbi:N-acetylglutaminylglutamine synthetase [Agaricicola taiwanensis]|nr:N-acetylglutaminylglutamine synthetase [Agaricicola taiwanensis]
MTTPPGKRGRDAYSHRFRRLREQGLRPPVPQETPGTEPAAIDAVLDCGWGRLIFAQTFADPAKIAQCMREEAPDQRDIAVYVRDPHVVIAAAPQELFLDPSHTYRLDLSHYRPSRRTFKGFAVRRVASRSDADEVNRIYATRNMVQVRPDFFWSSRDARALVHLVAEDEVTGAILGTVTGVDHGRAFADPERGTSLWCLAVDAQATRPSVGEALVRHLAEMFQARGAAFMDLSVLHDNEQAISLYDKLGFVRVPFFSIKHKNPINERLFVGEPPENKLNPYARILVDEARRRGIGVEITDAEGGFFRLTYGGRTIACRESLTELTTAIAMSICDDKAVTRRVAERAGITVPEQMEADIDDVPALEAFLAKHGQVVVKPARGEQGRGVAVGLDSIGAIETAIESAAKISDRVIIEQCVTGEDLRLIVINYKLVAAAIRRPARVIGDGRSTIRQLIERQSRRRAASTGGESRIPLDTETKRCIMTSGHALEDVLESGLELAVRRTANLHTGGTIHDVTDHVHPTLVEAAVRIARAIDIPVTGIDLMVPDYKGPGYAFIEANERPGLANHEPQPTAERFVDLLFPQSIPASARRAAGF